MMVTTRLLGVLLVVLVLLMGATAFFSYSAYSTVQSYGAKIASLERELTALKAHGDQIRSEGEAVAARVKRVEDEAARLRR
jgi:cell division protein FtsB